MSKDDRAGRKIHTLRALFVLCIFMAASFVYTNTCADVANSDDSWTCPNCGKVNTKLFCGDCGTKKPEQKWICVCGNENTTLFCENCGRSKEEGFQNNSSMQKSSVIPSNTINRMFGTWESNQGDKFIFRADGTCNINGEELYYIIKNWTFHTGQNANSMSTTYRIVSNNSKRCTLRITSGNDVGKTYILTATTTKESTTTPTKEPTASPTKKSTETPTKKPAIYNDYFFLELSEGWIYVSKSNLWINYNDKNRPGLLILDVCEEEGISISSLLQQQFINNWIAQIEKDNPEQVAYEDFSFLGIDTMLIQYQSDHKHYYHLPFWINNRVYTLIYMVVADQESNVDRSEVIRIANNIQVIASTLKPTATPSKPVVTPTKKPTATPTKKPTDSPNSTGTFLDTIFNIPVVGGYFSTRNDITFGLDSTTIIKKEASAGNTISQWNDAGRIVRGTVNAFGGSGNLLYAFDKKGVMVSMGYYLRSSVDYYDLKKAIENKYGEPLLINESTSRFNPVCWYMMSSWDVDTLSETPYTKKLQSPDGTVKLKRYDSWYLKYDNYYVVIELSQLGGSSGSLYGVQLGYCKVDINTMQTWLLGLAQQMQMTENSFSNDL